MELIRTDTSVVGVLKGDRFGLPPEMEIPFYLATIDSKVCSYIPAYASFTHVTKLTSARLTHRVLSPTQVSIFLGTRLLAIAEVNRDEPTGYSFDFLDAPLLSDLIVNYLSGIHRVEIGSVHCTAFYDPKVYVYPELRDKMQKIVDEDDDYDPYSHPETQDPMYLMSELDVFVINGCLTTLTDKDHHYFFYPYMGPLESNTFLKALMGAGHLNIHPLKHGGWAIIFTREEYEELREYNGGKGLEKYIAIDHQIKVNPALVCDIRI